MKPVPLSFETNAAVDQAVGALALIGSIWGFRFGVVGVTLGGWNLEGSACKPGRRAWLEKLRQPVVNKK